MKTLLLNQIVIKKNTFFVFFLIFVILSCETRQSGDANNIRSMLIDNEYSSFFKVPNSYKQVIDTSKLLIDGKFKVLLKTKLDTLIKINSNYGDAFKECFIIEKNKEIRIEDLAVNHRVHLKKQNKDVTEDLLEKFNVYISFSNIFFNEEMDKAVVLINVTYGSLNSSSDICFLQKVKGVWHIVAFQNKSFS